MNIYILHTNHAYMHMFTNGHVKKCIALSLSHTTAHITHSTVDSLSHTRTRAYLHMRACMHSIRRAVWAGGQRKAFPPTAATTATAHQSTRRQAQQVHVTLSRRVAQSLRQFVAASGKNKSKSTKQQAATCRPGRALVPECLPATTIAHTSTHAHTCTLACSHICGRVNECVCVCVNWQSQRNCSVSWQRTQRGSQSLLPLLLLLLWQSHKSSSTVGP